MASTFTRQLNRLFETVYPPGRGPYTLQEVADAINADGRASVSPSYLSQLRSGAKDNPSAKTIEALARFFDVRPDWFFDTQYARDLDEELALLAKLRDEGVQRIAARAFALPPRQRAAIESMMAALADEEPEPTGGSSTSAEQPENKTRDE